MRFKILLQLLFICISICLSGCVASDTSDSNKEAEALGIYFFACSDDADSCLIKNGESCIMVDTGLKADADDMIARLKELSVDDIDLLILTHPDKDHIGGVKKLVKSFKIKKILESDFDKGSYSEEKMDEAIKNLNVVTVYEDMELDFENLKLQIFPPEKEYGSSNNNSLVILASYKGKNILLPGDIKKKRLKNMMEKGFPKLDILKAPWHGRDFDGEREFILDVKTEYIVVTAKTPEPDFESAAEETGSQLLSTWNNEVGFMVNDTQILELE